jgi:hypothetical protein
MEDALTRVVLVLKNKNPKMTKQKYTHFLAAEVENILFLMSRVVRLAPQTFGIVKSAVAFANSSYHPQDPAIWLVNHELGIPNSEPVVSGYESEFPRAVEFGKLMIATRVFVAESLANWSFYQDQHKLGKIVDVGLTRFGHSRTSLTFRKFRLSQQSEFLIYFVTHIVLVATMWGGFGYPVGGTPKVWARIIEQLKTWLLLITPKDNLEIWLELLLCLELMHENEFVDSFHEKARELFAQKLVSKDPHRIYHTYVLWALLFAATREK